MSDTVESIGNSVFYNCSNLKQITVIRTGEGSGASFFREKLDGFEVIFEKG
jgi:hypothetical protein